MARPLKSYELLICMVISVFLGMLLRKFVFNNSEEPTVWEDHSEIRDTGLVSDSWSDTHVWKGGDPAIPGFDSLLNASVQESMAFAEKAIAQYDRVEKMLDEYEKMKKDLSKSRRRPIELTGGPSSITLPAADTLDISPILVPDYYVHSSVDTIVRSHTDDYVYYHLIIPRVVEHATYVMNKGYVWRTDTARDVSIQKGILRKHYISNMIGVDRIEYLDDKGKSFPDGTVVLQIIRDYTIIQNKRDTLTNQ